MGSVDPFLKGVNQFAMPYVRECARRLAEDPEDPDALFVRAAMLGTLGNLQGALDTLDILARVEPHYPGLWHFKARLYAELGNAQMRELCLETAKREAAAWGA